MNSIYVSLVGEIIEDDFNVDNETCCTKYKLTGIVVHSGQASGGHYYSYILHKLVFFLSYIYYNLSMKATAVAVSKLCICIFVVFVMERRGS